MYLPFDLFSFVSFFKVDSHAFVAKDKVTGYVIGSILPVKIACSHVMYFDWFTKTADSLIL